MDIPEGSGTISGKLEVVADGKKFPQGSGTIAGSLGVNKQGQAAISDVPEWRAKWPDGQTEFGTCQS